MEFGISRRDLVQLVKIGMQSREMGRCIKNVVCFFLCPDADCLRNNLSNRTKISNNEFKKATQSKRLDSLFIMIEKVIEFRFAEMNKRLRIS